MQIYNQGVGDALKYNKSYPLVNYLWVTFCIFAE